MKKRLLYTLIVLFSVQLSAQKIKYKDLFPLLEAKVYDQGEPMLRQFLSDPKNAEEPNANLQMALLLDQYFVQGDILSNREEVFAIGDSAISFYQKSIELIDDKELRKNDQFYQSFYRRDLRTGEFGIKVSDVHLDIEKKIETIELRKSNVDKFSMLLESTAETEKSLVAAFNDLVDTYSSYNDFVLAAGADQISQMGTLTDFQDKINDNATEIAEIAKTLGIADRYSRLEVAWIADFKKLESVFSPSSFKCHDVKTWSADAKAVISGEVATLKRRMDVLNSQLARAKQEMSEGVSSSFPPRLAPQLRELSQKYDPNNVPSKVLSARISENIVLSLSDQEVNEDWQDSTQIAYHVVTCDSILSQLANLDEMTNGLADAVSASGKYYGDFFTNGFGSVDGASDYIRTLAEWTAAEKVRWDTVSAFWNERNMWGLGATDSIPLVKAPEGFEGVYQTQGSWKVESFDLIPFGVKTDSTIGFTARFGPTRQLVWEARFESLLFDQEDLSDLEMGQLQSSGDDLAFYIFDPSTEEGAENLTVVSTTLDGATNWNVSLVVDQKPDHNSYNENIKSHTIYLFPEDAYPLDGGKLGYVIINRNGEAQQ